MTTKTGSDFGLTKNTLQICSSFAEEAHMLKVNTLVNSFLEHRPVAWKRTEHNFCFQKHTEHNKSVFFYFTQETHFESLTVNSFP